LRPMKRILLPVLAITILLYSCSGKKTEGTVNYSVEYLLPDSLKQYAQYLPKQAVVYFKGDSTISIQETKEESTSVITVPKAGFMRALLKSTDKHFVIDYDKDAQAEERSIMPSYTFTKSAQHKTIAGYDAVKYDMKDKQTGESAEAWFTKDIVVIPNSLTVNLDTALGVPLSFTLKQNGIVVKTTVNQVMFETIPEGAFSTPKGYEFITPQKFKEMTSGN
jgi:hypothetical protein